MLPHERLRMGEHDFRAFVIEGHGRDFMPPRASEEPPQAADGAGITLPVPTGDGHAAEAMREAPVLTLAGGPEGVALPVVEGNAELLSERQEI